VLSKEVDEALFSVFVEERYFNVASGEEKQEYWNTLTKQQKWMTYFCSLYGPTVVRKISNNYLSKFYNTFQLALQRSIAVFLELKRKYPKQEQVVKTAMDDFYRNDPDQRNANFTIYFCDYVAATNVLRTFTTA